MYPALYAVNFVESICKELTFEKLPVGTAAAAAAIAAYTNV